MSDAVAWHTAIARDFAARYRQSPAFAERERVWCALIKRFGKSGGCVLDAGCGSGVMAVLAAAEAKTVSAFDASPAMLQIARETVEAAGLRNVELHQGQLGDPLLTHGRQFDLILCSSVLEYQDDWWRTLDWLEAGLAPGGTILFSMPNADSVYRRAERLLFRFTGHPAYYAHVRAVPNLSEITRGLQKRGLLVEASQFYAAAPLLSPVLRPLGLRRFADTLFVVACRRF